MVRDMIRKIILPGIVLTFCLSGCTMIPEYSRPGAPVPVKWPDGPAYRESRLPSIHPVAADLPWRQFFTDDRLREVIVSALENNRDLRIAALNVERARAYYRIQRAELLPTVDATGSGYRERVPADLSSTGRRTTMEEYRADLGISSWEIDFFGRIRSLEKRALEEYLATEEARRSAQILLISEVANVYLTLAMDRENLQLARSTLEAQQASYNLIRRRFEVGIAPKLDLRQVQQRVDAARVDVARYTELAAQDENALNLLAGKPVPAVLLPQGLSAVTPLPDVSPGMSSEVLLLRPDILRAERLLQASNADIGAARAAFFPRISLTTAFGTASDDLSGLFKSGSDTWMFAPGITLPIFDPRIWAALRVSKAEREIALARYEGAIQTAFKEVADALATKGTVGDQITAQESLVEATAETYQLSYARYEKGSDTYLSVLDAQRSLYAAQQGLIAIRRANFANQVRLYAVLGGGGDLN
ncbi:MAG TPA: efflux transporter outer membrane subunit [Desulfobacterales bacterium]|nr:efflux transporter outer membrane subunit [Desulfobacterales bacterium]